MFWGARFVSPFPTTVLRASRLRQDAMCRSLRKGGQTAASGSADGFVGFLSSRETASNLRKIFDFAAVQPVVLLLDEFDAIARLRDDETLNGELRRVVNSLLVLVEQFRGQGFVIAATNHERQLDRAIWRRFDEVIFFEKPAKI